MPTTRRTFEPNPEVRRSATPRHSGHRRDKFPDVVAALVVDGVSADRRLCSHCCRSERLMRILPGLTEAEPMSHRPTLDLLCLRRSAP